MTKVKKLSRYNRMRDFDTTPEPAGKVDRSESGRLYLIQKHASSHLHYDFRLELDGVLLSWAVPKGPSLDPADKRLAMHVEGHPVEYGRFEGIIPQGEYGGGTVMLWDRGEWEPIGDPRKGYAKGHLRFRLEGERLKGVWNLVESPGKWDDRGKKWLLIKSRDEEAVSRGEWDIVAEEARSVATGRTMEEIAAEKDRVWRSHGRKVKRARAASPLRTPRVARRRLSSASGGPSPATLTGARKKEMPKELHPQLATLADQPPPGSRWIHEIKFDGYRLLARIARGEVTLLTRRGEDWTHRFPTVAKALTELGLETAILDGEVVALDSGGLSSFQKLQNSLSGRGAASISYYLFDVPYCEGYDLTEAPLIERKEFLRGIHGRAPGVHAVLRYSDHIEGEGAAVLEKSCHWSVEGLISKLKDSRYLQDRSKTWIKSKCTQRQEFVIAGFTRPSGRRHGFGSLLLGYFDDAGDLHYAGRVGTGFDGESISRILEQMKPLVVNVSPFRSRLQGVAARGAITYIEPELVGEVEFTEWTEGGQLRHPSFQGMRLDKEAKDVKRESPGPIQTLVKKSVASRKGETRTAGVRISNPDRVLYPDPGITKRDLAAYYVSIADWILPHVTKRPLTLVRCPTGSEGPCFYQKHITDSLPEAVRGIEVNEGEEPYVILDDLRGLVSLVQMGVLELHPWGSREDRLEFPDRVVMDLDPGPGVPWAKTVEGAFIVKEFLEEIGLTSFPRTTGGKGLHLVIPLTRRADWNEVVVFTKEIASTLSRIHPHRFVAKMSKARRTGKIFLDYLRNGRGATAVASYSPRARDGAPVATPITWDELTPRLDPEAFDVRTLPARLAKLRMDPWDGIDDVKQSITARCRKLLRAA